RGDVQSAQHVQLGAAYAGVWRRSNAHELQLGCVRPDYVDGRDAAHHAVRREIRLLKRVRYWFLPPICTSKPSGSCTWKLPSVVRIFRPRFFNSASTAGLTLLSVSHPASE